MKQFPELSEDAFVEMGDFVGFTLKQCKKQGVKRVSMVGMMGKFSKVAMGIMMVHSKSAPVDFQFLADVAGDSGADFALIEEIKTANTASQVGDMMVAHGHLPFFERLCDYCCLAALKEVDGGIAVDTSLYTMKGEFLGKAVRDNGID
jgi:cobalt-precorrin-5B (C1)-methyltransferase